MNMKKFKKLLLLLLISGIYVNVWAENENTGETKNETEEVITKKSNDTTLKDVYFNNEKVVCSNYVCEKIIENNDINKVTITYKTNDAKATVSTEKLEKELKNGLNEFKVTVTAEDGTSKDYTFKITKKVLSTDSSLKKITVNGEEVTLKKDVTKYNVSVSFAAKKIEIEATPNSSAAKIDGFKSNKISYDFFDTEKEIKIKVIAEAGDMTTYVLNVTKREEQVVTLKNITIKNAKINFESGVYDYELSVPKSVEKLEIDATPTNQDAKVTITGADKLQIGENTITIEVENDGNTKTYTIKVTRLESDDKSLANLKSIEIEKYKLDFKEDKYEYDLKIGDDNYLVIKALPKVDTSDVQITGNLDLENGSIIKIKVQYNDETTSIYKINIIKEAVTEKKNNTSKLVIIIVITLIIIAIVVILIMQLKNKKNKNDVNKNEKKEKKEIDKKETEIESENKNKKQSIITLSDDEEIEDII